MDLGWPILAYFARVGCHGRVGLTRFSEFMFVKMETPTLFRKKREIGWGTLGFSAGRKER